MNPVQFSREQRRLVIHAADEAEERTSSYYCFPPHRWQVLRYDLLTRQDHEWEPLPETHPRPRSADRGGRAGTRRNYEFYRIQLNDPGILLGGRQGEPFGRSLPVPRFHHHARTGAPGAAEQHRGRPPAYRGGARLRGSARPADRAPGALGQRISQAFDDVLDRFCVPLAPSVDSHLELLQ